MSERISSGIPGLDEVIQGGFFKKSINLVSGGTGTGKSIFGLQYILHGLKNGQNGVYISLEQEPENIMGDVKHFGWDFEKYIKEKKCVMEYLPSWKLEELPVIVIEKINDIGAKRFVLDTLTLVCSRLDKIAIRAEISEFLGQLKKSGVTSLLLSEIPEGTKKLSRFGIEEFLADSIIILHYLDYAAGGSTRSLMVRKMRRTDHGTDIYPMSITDNGLVIKK
jgi:KaiC/GvpD/RAD55 family RecA-like ATPase